MNLNFTAEHLEQNNPFYFMFDHRLELLQFGKSLKKLVPTISSGSAFTEFFTVLRPNIIDDFEKIRSSEQALFILKIKSSTLQMKGRMLYFQSNNCILFLGSPAITKLEQMKDTGLSINDFSLHDPMVDYLFLLQAANTSLSESKQFADELAVRTAEEKKGLAKFPSESPHPILRLRHDGTIIYANNSSAPLLDYWKAGIGQPLDQRWSNLLLPHTPNGVINGVEIACNERFYFLDTISVEGTNYVNVYGRDVTDRKVSEAYAEEARMKAMYSAKMASLGEMAAGIAHEINNPLTIISMKVRQIQNAILKDRGDRDFLINGLKNIHMTIDRIANIIAGMSTFSQVKEEVFEPTSVKKIIDDTLALCYEKFKVYKINLVLLPVSSKIILKCNHVQISQALLNLLNNSFDAIKELDEKWLRIEVREESKFIKIRITDSGKGIAEKDKDKVFTPFFTTKPIGQGTGLGLSVSLGITQAHGGSLEFDPSSSNTTIEMILPKETVLE